MKDRTNSNDPAFPVGGNPGLSKREWLAGKVAGGLAEIGFKNSDIAEQSVNVADLIIEQLNEEREIDPH